LVGELSSKSIFSVVLAIWSDFDPDRLGAIASPDFESYADQTPWVSGTSLSILDRIRTATKGRLFVGNEINPSTAISSGVGFFACLWR
jgi:hypothetical protein